MLPAKLYLQFICSKYQFRSQTTDNSTGLEVLGDFGGPATARFCVPFRDYTRDLVRAGGGGGGGGGARVSPEADPPVPALGRGGSAG